MKTLTAALILEKNKLTSKVPWVTLFEIDLDGTDYLRLAAYPENILFPNTTDGDTYTAFPAIVESITETAQGTLDTLRVHVANVDRVPFEPHGRDHAVEQLAGLPHERLPLPILLVPRALAHEDQPGIAVAAVKNAVRPLQM